MPIRTLEHSSLILFEESFSSLQDPRRMDKGNVHYSLEEIIFLTVSASVCGYSAWTAIEEFGKLKIDWLRKFYLFKKIPSHDALGDFFSALDSKAFAQCFLGWVQAVVKKAASKVVPIDGKTIRGAASSGSKYPQHIVSAFCARNRLCLGQVAVAEKENEITAIPELLDILFIENSIVTIDAIGCQKAIAEKIIEKRADYILQVKDNQKYLKDQIEDVFNGSAPRNTNAKTNVGYGRIENRICEAIAVKDIYFEDGDEWAKLKSIVRIQSFRTIKKTGVKSEEYRYYISSLKADGALINDAIRSHWSIENNLHWELDVLYNEDGQLKRAGNSAQNANIISKVALGLLENEKTVKKTKPLKRLNAAHNDHYRELVLKI
jgi:predicted transposase YbfD/YdcC